MVEHLYYEQTVTGSIPVDVARKAKVSRNSGRKYGNSIVEIQYGMVEFARQNHLIEKLGIMRDRTSLVRLKSRLSSSGS